jgi:hypothetical protein
MRSGFIIAVLLAVFATAPFAQTLYKLIDKNGKVTYADTPPKDYDGKVVPIDIDPNRNRATLTTPGSAEREQALNEKTRAGESAEQRVKQARERVEGAKRNLATVRDNPLDNEVERVGKAGGGTRPVYSESYERRVAALEKEVKDAEEELRRVERAR